MALPENTRTVSLIVPRALVKTVKSALEGRGLFGKRIEKIGSGGGGGGGGADDNRGEELFKLSTTLSPDNRNDEAAGGSAGGAGILRLLGLVPHAARITVASTAAPAPAAPAPAPAPAPPRNPLISAISAYLSTHHPALPPSTAATLLHTAPHRWSLYPPLALLPANSFASPPWTSLLATLSPALTATLFSTVASALSATHLAINAPIPPSSPLRLPLHLTPLHGDFGPTCTHTPTPTDHAAAFWCTARQNGIWQTWAPRHTMFSRGNVKEKARVLGFPGVAGTQVVDLFAGIGYFAFSYVAAGAARVWCWEVNPWSVEALLRGARGNGWGAVVVREGEEVQVDGERLVVFMEDNKGAGERVRGLGLAGAVRHVNLGLLPSSRGAWGTAVGIVEEGGWVHVHENVASGELAEFTGAVVREFEALEGEIGRGRTIKCGHVEEVKTFAPGVMHCVLDLRVGAD